MVIAHFSARDVLPRMIAPLLLFVVGVGLTSYYAMNFGVQFKKHPGVLLDIALMWPLLARTTFVDVLILYRIWFRGGSALSLEGEDLIYIHKLIGHAKVGDLEKVVSRRSELWGHRELLLQKKQGGIHILKRIIREDSESIALALGLRLEREASSDEAGASLRR